MNENQRTKLEDMKVDLTKMYWNLIDNKQMREAKRIDTIIGKIEVLLNL